MEYNKEYIRSKEHLHKDFICVWDDIIPKEFCLSLIDIIEASNFVVDRKDEFRQDEQIELSAFYPNQTNFLMDFVNICALEYMEKYPFLKSTIYHSSSTIIQKTKPTEGYHMFHCEDLTWAYQNRCLAWMIYLNDIEDGGETEFLYQKLKIKPKLGRIVIWPGSFTHLHRGNPPLQTKYIATGWYVSAHGYERKIFNPRC